MTKLSVIIPYFQRDRGVLRRAVNSVLQQSLPAEATLEIIVVDDGSPLPAAQELEGLDVSSPFHLTVVKQPNGGVAAARDAGLKHVDEKTEYIAFLDSDDSWQPDHAAQAIAALDSGYDFYFTDHGRTGHHESHFSAIGFPPANAPSGALKKLSNTLWKIDKDYYFAFALRTFTAQISTVVYRRTIHPAASFKAFLRHSGEDRLFMLEVISRARKVCFRNEVSVTCGEGVNIYYSTFGWEDEGHLRRHMSDILAAYALRSAFALTSSQKKDVQTMIAHNRKCFAYFTLRWFLKRRTWSPALVNLMREDKTFWLWYPFNVLLAAMLYSMGLFKPG